MYEKEQGAGAKPPTFSQQFDVIQQPLLLSGSDPVMPTASACTDNILADVAFKSNARLRAC
eukprot:16429934-Heterocapsa_arctica.AAC.1